MFGRMTEQQSETELVESPLSSDLSGKPDQYFAGSREPLLICEPRPRIDNVNSKSRRARQRRHRHGYLTGAEDEKIGVIGNDLDKKLDIRLLFLDHELKIFVESHCARETF
jgi:hypothetical protein